MYYRQAKVAQVRSMRPLSSDVAKGILKAARQGKWISIKELAATARMSVSSVKRVITHLKKNVITNMHVEYRAAKRYRDWTCDVRLTLSNSKED